MGDLRVSFIKRKRAQVWIETVIYTLIALSLMAMLLAFAKPKIDGVKDRMLIEQTIDSMNKIGEQIGEVQIAPNNKRVLTVKINKGKLEILPQADSLSWVLDSSYKYSEIGRDSPIGNLHVLTTGKGPYNVRVYSNYSTNITYNGDEKGFSLEASPTPYTVIVSSITSGGSLIVDISAK
jgi:hypothetical protein